MNEILKNKMKIMNNECMDKSFIYDVKTICYNIVLFLYYYKKYNIK